MDGFFTCKRIKVKTIHNFQILRQNRRIEVINLNFTAVLK